MYDNNTPYFRQRQDDAKIRNILQEYWSIFTLLQIILNFKELGRSEHRYFTIKVFS